MPERSFGRTVRYRRTKMGLSQTKLGELVGRSASSIRSWERDSSTPTDASVISALSAILDLDERALFEKAGMMRPDKAESPTVEQALASLTDNESPVASPPEVMQDLGNDEEPEDEQETLFETAPEPSEDDLNPTHAPRAQPTPAAVTIRIPGGESYVEDEVQRQTYRVRAMATALLVVVLAIVLIWAVGNTFDALGSWWDEFVGTLRL